jgi:purine catabolism regulator
MESAVKESFTVRQLFDIAPFAEARLLGGSEGLDRPISRVNVMEVPDVVDWVRPGEFLMTTGYTFKDRPETLVTLIAELAGKGIAALGLKTKRFVEHVSAAAIEAADRNGMPLIELPPDTAFSDVVREVMERVLVSESRYLSILQARVQRLSHVLLHGDGLPAFMQHLQAMVQNPVVLLDSANKPLYSPDAAALCSGMPESEWERIRGDQLLETNILQLQHGSCQIHISTVPGESFRSYLLLVLEHASDYGVVDSLTINWACRLLGFEISNMQARRTIEAKYSDQFLQDWLAGRIMAEVDLKLRSEACGWPLQEGIVYQAGVISFHEGGPDLKRLREQLRRLNWDSSERGHSLSWTMIEGRLAVLMAAHQGANAELPQQAFQELASEARSKVLALHNQPLSLCLGRVVPAPNQVAGSYKEACRTSEIGKVCRMGSPVIHYDGLGAYMLLYRLLDTEELREFKQLYLEPLLELDRRQPSSLLQTLRMYFQCNCNAKETAERMFVHYNTIVYRLDRIKSELNLRLDDPETKLLLQLAIKSHEVDAAEV